MRRKKVRRGKAPEVMPPEGQLPEQTLEELKAALGVLRSKGMRLHPAGRFAQYYKTLEQVTHSQGADPTVYAQAHLECSQLLCITQELGDCSEPVFLDKLRKVTSDTVLPQEAAAETPGRDAQFELFLAAGLKRNGLAVSFEEPDLVVGDGLIHIGVAAKRIKSMRRLQSRIAEAFRQLRGRGEDQMITHGIAAVDVTYAANPTGLVAALSSTQAQGPTAGVELVQNVARGMLQSSTLLPFAHKPKQHLNCAVVLFGAAVTFHTDVGGVINSWGFQVLLCDNRFQSIFDLLKSGTRLRD